MSLHFCRPGTRAPCSASLAHTPPAPRPARRPLRPDAAVIVGALQDAYVAQSSVVRLHAHLPGSEVRWVRGGHVTSFIMHHAAFRQAVVDSLARL